MKIVEEQKLDFSDVLIRPCYSDMSSRKEANIYRKFNFLHSNRSWEGFPIISANMDSVSTYSMAKALNNLKCMTAVHKHYSIEEIVEFYKDEKEVAENNSFYTLGIGELDYEKYNAVKNFLGFDLPFVCIDVANGYMQKFLDFLKMFKNDNPDSVIMAGNVVTPEGAVKIIEAGASIVKLGIGQGSACRTRVVAGVGVPQLSTILDTVDAVHALGGLICSDGGCSKPADIAKAFGAGADFVMLGGMLAGHSESGGEIFTDENGKKKMFFYGMSSETAMNKHNGGMAAHRSSEGRTVAIEYRGEVSNTIGEIAGGVRSAMTYTNSHNLEEFYKNVVFVKIRNELNLSLAHHTTGN